MKGTVILNNHLTPEDEEALTWLVLRLLEEDVVLGIDTLVSYTFQLKVEYETTDEGEEVNE